MYPRLYKFTLMFCLFLFQTERSIAQNDNRLLDLRKKIELAAIEEIKRTNTPSLQISIGTDNQIIYQDAFGLSDIENQVVATPKTKYRTASIAKWFTAAAAMQLVEQKKLDLDKAVQEYCPQYPLKKWTITTRDLLTHTSGIRHYIDYKKLIASAKSQEERIYLNKKHIVAQLNSYKRFNEVISPLEDFKNDALLFRPASNWKYTSFGYRLLACVIQGAADSNYRKLMAELIFTPLNMNNTIEDDAWKITPNRASGYRLQDGNLRRADMRDVSNNLPAGGYLSTSTDLVKFAMGFNNGLLSKKSILQMSSPVMVEEVDVHQPLSWRDAIPSKDKYGYGLMLFSKYEKGMIGHTGRQAGGSAILVLSLDKNISIAIMTNSKGWNGYLNFAMKINSIVKQHLLDAA